MTLMEHWAKDRYSTRRTAFTSTVSRFDAAILPNGWQARMIKVSTLGTNRKVGWCLEGHDLAASKLAAFRDKDREFVRVLIRERYVNPPDLVARIRELGVDEELRHRIIKWIEFTVGDF